MAYVDIEEMVARLLIWHAVAVAVTYPFRPPDATRLEPAETP
jgi:hypothetical protein